MLNVYSDNQQVALEYLKDTEVNLHNVIIMIGDFNIRNSNWDPLYPFCSVYGKSLIDITDSFNLVLSCSI